MKAILALLPLLILHSPVEASPSRAKIEADLVLEAVLSETPPVIQVGERVALNIFLRNQSKTDSYPVVKTGDGSEVGWREPHVFYTATLTTSEGKTQEVPPMPLGRCGLFDDDWNKDAVELKPGEKLPLQDWLAQPSDVLEFQKAGRVRVTVHYRYSAGENKRKKGPASGLMSGLPAFELVSRPVEFEVVRPLDLVLAVRKPLKTKTRTKLSDLFSLRLVNQSAEAREFTPPTLSGASRLFFQAQMKSGGPLVFSQEKSRDPAKQLLQPGESSDLLGDTASANGMDGLWEIPLAESIRVRACFVPSSSQGNAVLYSEWIEVQSVEKP